jgi:vacuolar iron transporter family protein
MGLGAYLAAITDKRHYEVEEARERRQVIQNPEQEHEIMSRIFSEYGIGAEQLQPMAEKLRSDPDAWVKVLISLISICLLLTVYFFAVYDEL